LMPAYASAMRGRSMLLVDGCRRSGGALERCVDVARQAGADVIGCAAIWEWPGTRQASPMPVTVLCDWLRADGVPLKECPLCHAGHQAQRVGSGSLPLAWGSTVIRL
jgi:hypothetical protein